MRESQRAISKGMLTNHTDQILEPGAKDRIKRMALVKEERARSIEDSLINAAKSGKLKGKVHDIKVDDCTVSRSIVYFQTR